MQNYNSKLKILIFLVLFSSFYILYSSSVFAVDYIPLVPCGLSEENAEQLKAEGKGDPDIDYARPCAKCDTFKLAENVIDFVLLGLVPPVAAVLFIAAGLMIVLAGANQSLYANGILIFKSTFWGLVIILASWMITNTFLKSFAPDQADAPWYRLICEEGVITTPPPSDCSDPAGLAVKYNTAYPKKNAPELNTLISCVNSKLSDFIDQSQIFTYEKTNVLCNYTRGNEICGNCAHKVNSCHYGGSNGTTGARAVDFNAKGISEKELFNKLDAIRNQCNFGFILFETNHTHVSTKSCAGDTGGD